jgi:hypothetical protein
MRKDLHFSWLVEPWKTSREQYLRAWQAQGWHCILWHCGQISETPVEGVELRNAYELILGSSIEDVFAYEREHWSHASCADLFRYLLLLKRGGAYADIDVLPYSDTPLPSKNWPLFGVPNPPAGEVALEIRFISARVGHELLQRLLTKAEHNERAFLHRGGYKRNKFDSVVQRTGPGMAIGVVERYAQEFERPLQDFLLNATRDNTPENNLEHHGPHRLKVPPEPKKSIRDHMRRVFDKTRKDVLPGGGSQPG